MLKRILSLMLVLMLVLGALSGCASTPAAEEPAAEEPAAEEPAAEEPAPVKDTIVVALSADITSLDPMGHNDTKSEKVSFLVFNRLFRLNTDFEVVPDLAESWEQPTPEEWVIKIKEGVKFHDGSDLTADDVVYSLLRSKEMPKVQQVLSEVASVEKVDEYTVKVTTNTPFAPFLYTLVHAGTSIVPENAAPAGEEISDPVGSGPYTFKDWQSGDKVTLEKFDAYFDADNMGQTQNIVFRIIPEGTSRTIALETGEVDVVDELETIDIAKVEENPDLALLTKPSTKLDFFAMNSEKEPFGNELIRQAFNYAIDKEAVMEVAINGAGVIAESIMAPSFLGYTPGPYSYDPEKAKELLAAAGYGDGLDIVIWASGDERKRIAEVIQAYLLDVGVTSSIEMFEWGTYIDRILAGEAQTFVLAWTSNPDPDATLTPHYFSGNIGGMNFSRTNDPAIDDMLKVAREELDLAKRKALYEEFHTYVMEKAPIVPLFVKSNVSGANAGLKGVELSPQGLWNIEKIHY